MQSNDSEKQPGLESDFKAALDDPQEIYKKLDQLMLTMNQLDSIIKENPHEAALSRIIAVTDMQNMIQDILSKLVTKCERQEDMASALSEEQKVQVSEIVQKDPELIEILPLHQLMQKRKEGDTTECAVM